uniref:(northern house mosquito) hypothetical protein n=2 Tax=Culex pipiens TaxID=7175 RepID=A0A8D8HNL6_CULPI
MVRHRCPRSPFIPHGSRLTNSRHCLPSSLLSAVSVRVECQQDVLPKPQLHATVLSVSRRVLVQRNGQPTTAAKCRRRSTVPALVQLDRRGGHPADSLRTTQHFAGGLDSDGLFAGVDRNGSGVRILRMLHK